MSGTVASQFAFDIATGYFDSAEIVSMNNADDRSKVGREWIAFVSIWIPYSLLTYRFWHNVDDAFISFRYAKNWAMGYGLRYNVGPQQPEEGYSNFLWVVVCTFIEHLELDVTFWAPMLGFACGSLLLYLVFRTLRRDFNMELGVAFSITLGLGLFPPYALWSTGGLGTMAFALSTFATAYFLVLRPAGISPYRGALAGVATALLRTEGIAWALLIALIGIVTRRMKGEAVWRPVAVYVAIVSTAFSVYFAWRYSYYQLFFPNPVYAKVGFSPEVALRGFRYVASFALTFVTPILLLPTAGYFAWREAPKPVALTLGTLSLAFPAYAVVVGGDWMAMGRFLVPAFAFGALLMGWLVARLWKRLTSRLVVMAVVITTITVGLLPVWNAHLVPASVRHAFHFRYDWEYKTTDKVCWGARSPGIAPPEAVRSKYSCGFPMVETEQPPSRSQECTFALGLDVTGRCRLFPSSARDRRSPSVRRKRPWV